MPITGNTVVVRGGQCTVAAFENGAERVDTQDKLYNLSVQLSDGTAKLNDATFNALLAPTPYTHGSAVFAQRIMDKGGKIERNPIPGNPQHGLVSNITAADLYDVMKDQVKSFVVTMAKQEVFNQLKAGMNCEQASGYSISTLKELLSDLQPVNYKWLTYSRDGHSWSAEIKGNSWGTNLDTIEPGIAYPTIVEKLSQAIQAAVRANLLVNPYTPEAVEGLILRVSDAIAAAAKIPYMLKDLMPMYGAGSPTTGFSSGETWTKKDLPFLVEAIESKGFSQTGRSKDFNADKVGGEMSIPKPVTVDVNGTMSVEDYKACSMIMAVCQNMVQKTLTDAAREAGVPATDALKDMNAWVQAYVDFPFPFFTFKDTQNKTYQKKDFSLTADPDVVENIVNIKNVDGLKDAVVGALRKSGGNLASYESTDTKFNYFGVITAYNETEIATRVIKFQMNLKTTVVKTLCGGSATTNLDTSYDTYQFVADKQLMIKMQAKMGDKLADYFADKLLNFIQTFYDEQLGTYKQNLTALVKNLKKQ